MSPRWVLAAMLVVLSGVVGVACAGSQGPAGLAGSPGPTGSPGTPATRMFGLVAGSGATTLVYGTGIKAATAGGGSNELDLTFGQAMSACACSATIEATVNPGFVRLAMAYPTSNQVAVFTNDAAQTLVHLPFYVACFCR